MKRIIFAIAALFCTTLSFAQEYMIIENNAGGWTSIDVSVISQAYFKEFPTSGEGTKENPFNVAAANAKCKEIGTEPSVEKYYVKGIVVSTGNNSDGPAAYIADDNSGINRLYIYRINVPEGITLSRNDEVVIYGVLYHYRNLTTEMKGDVVAINGQDISGGNVETVPISNVIAGEDGVTYCVRGEVTKIANTKYGNFYIKDETGEVYIYGTQDANGSWNFANLGIEVGDIVTVMGPKKTYNGTVELVNVRVLKIEKPVIEQSDEAKAVSIAQFNEAAESTEVWYQLTGTISNLKDNDQYGNFDLTDETGSVYVYGLLSEKGGEKKKFQELVAAKGIANGSKITIIGNRGSYGGKIEVTNAYFVSIEGEGGGEQGGGVNANKNTSGPTEAQYRYEFPKLKGGNNVVVVHKSILNKDTNEEGVNYCVEWNPSIRAQRWSCYQLYNSVNYGSGNVTRYSADNDGSLSPECQYPNDPDLPAEYQFTVDSYRGSGYDHGHICPSADRLRATECNYQTFFITNMQPQNNNFNAGIWADMEVQVRTWAKNFDTLYVCKGGTIDNRNYIIKYLGSGNNQIPVPQYFFMAMLGKKGSTYKATGFWIDQSNHPSTSIKDYAVTIQELEEETGIDFFCNLPDNIENSVETVSKSTMESEWNWPN